MANRVGLNPVCKWGDESCPEGELAAEMLEMMEIKQAVLGTESALLEGNGITNKTSVKKMSWERQSFNQDMNYKWQSTW